MLSDLEGLPPSQDNSPYPRALEKWVQHPNAPQGDRCLLDTQSGHHSPL